MQHNHLQVRPPVATASVDEEQVITINPSETPGDRAALVQVFAHFLVRIAYKQDRVQSAQQPSHKAA